MVQDTGIGIPCQPGLDSGDETMKPATVGFEWVRFGLGVEQSNISGCYQ